MKSVTELAWNRNRLELLLAFLLLSLVLSGCTPDAQRSCPVTDPAWVLSPEDSAVSGTPEHGYYFANEDETILASAWWFDQDEVYLRAGEEGVKVGWFRPAGAELVIEGTRIDGEDGAFRAEVPCCYPTRFQATGLYFSSDGCWEITASAADSRLSFVVWVEP